MRSDRFEKSLDQAMVRLNASIDFDERLYAEDIQGSVAWARALESSGLITAAERLSITEGLEKIRVQIEAGQITFSRELEDIHMNVEARLTEAVGPAGEKLHTGRSRNDQVVTDLRLYVKRAAIDIASQIASLALSAVDVAEREIEVIIPAYTHLQRAQPVLLSHHLLAYSEMMARDHERFRWAAKQADVCSLGSAACVGNQFGVDRELLRTELGFERLTHNSMDAVSDRDFVCDFLHAASLLMVHLSRWSEDLILWSTAEFGFVTLDDSVTTGSSMLPQKKNPDACELARGKTGRVVGNLMGLLVTLKGLPLTYNKDLQEDKEGLFDTIDTLSSVLPVFQAMIESLEVNRERAAASLEGGFLDAMGLADVLTRKGVPFREAHGVVGKAVREAERQGMELRDLPLETYKEMHKRFGPDVFDALCLEALVADKDVVGGTAPTRVRAEIKRLREKLGKSKTK